VIGGPQFVIPRRTAEPGTGSVVSRQRELFDSKTSRGSSSEPELQVCEL
jgi:hypothetical protein